MRSGFLFAIKWSLVGLIFALAYLGIKSLTPHIAAPGVAGIAESYAAAAAKAMPSVVSIRTATAVRRRTNPLLADPLFQEFFNAPGGAVPPTEYETSLGSGVIVGEELILTNHHVIDGVDRIEIVLIDGRHGEATVLGVDPETDLAVLRSTMKLPTAITFGSPHDTQIGDIALAIGNPLGIGLTVTQGIVSATGRDRIGINAFENFIQTDAAINPGNSGGALVNINGELIGVNAAILGYQGIGFAIPGDMARAVLHELINNGEVTRGWLGIEARDLSAPLRKRFDISSERGILVLSVMPQGPAALAGVQTGDVIFKIDGRAVSDSRDALNTIANLKPAERALLTIERQRNIVEVTATVQSRPQVRR